MPWQLATAFLALAACATLAPVLRSRGASLRFRLRRAGMEQAWQAWLKHAPKDEKQLALRQGLLAQMDEVVRDSVRTNLLEFEAGLKADKAPLQMLRRELMDSVDRRLLNMEILQLPPEVRQRLRAQSRDMLQTDEEARTYVAANEMRMGVLREYSALRFGDRVEGDWFDVYEQASRLKQRGARNFIQRTLNGTQSSEDDARYQSMTRVDQEIRTRLLKVPAGTRFARSPAGKPVTDEYPSLAVACWRSYDGKPDARPIRRPNRSTPCLTPPPSPAGVSSRTQTASPGCASTNPVPAPTCSPARSCRSWGSASRNWRRSSPGAW